MAIGLPAATAERCRLVAMVAPRPPSAPGRPGADVAELLPPSRPPGTTALALRDDVGDCDADPDPLGVPEGEAVTDGELDRDADTLAVAEPDDVALAVCDALGVREGVRVPVRECVPDMLGVRVRVADCEALCVGVGVPLSVLVPDAVVEGVPLCETDCVGVTVPVPEPEPDPLPV